MIREERWKADNLRQGRRSLGLGAHPWLDGRHAAERPRYQRQEIALIAQRIERIANANGNLTTLDNLGIVLSTIGPFPPTGVKRRVTRRKVGDLVQPVAFFAFDNAEKKES